MITRSQPLADQVRRQILQWIQANRSDHEGGALPSETELAEMFATSRATVREALAELERGRLVIRRQGSGTYVSPAFSRLANIVNELNDPMQLIEQQGCTVAIGRKEHDQAPAGEAVSGLLEIAPDDPVLNLRVLYLADGLSAAGLVGIIPLMRSLAHPARLPSFGGLVRFAADVSGLTATHSITSLKAIGADESLASFMGIPAGQPVQVMDELYLTDYGHPAFHSSLYLLSDRIQLDLLRNSDQAADHVVIW